MQVIHAYIDLEDSLRCEKLMEECPSECLIWIFKAQTLNPCRDIITINPPERFHPFVMSHVFLWSHWHSHLFYNLLLSKTPPFKTNWTQDKAICRFPKVVIQKLKIRKSQTSSNPKNSLCQILQRKHWNKDSLTALKCIKVLPRHCKSMCMGG